jgi:topoisomerase-4 subunit A
VLKQKGGSTLGGTDIYFDRDVLRLNVDKRGEYIGNFDGDDQILVVTKSGDFYTTSFDLNNHYDDDLMLIEKFDAAKVWTAVLYDDEQKYHYIKRFAFEVVKNRTSYLIVGGNSRVDLLTDTVYPRLKVTFGGGDSFREAIEIDAEEFIGVKGYKAKGKRLSNYVVAEVEELEPLRQPEQIVDDRLQITEDGSGNPEDVLAGIEIVSTQPEDPEQIVDDGQMSLF